MDEELADFRRAEYRRLVGAASVPVGGDVFAEFCGALAMYEVDTDRWEQVTSPEFSLWGRDPDARTWSLRPIPAGPVVLLLGWISDDPVMLAYRHP